ncbi:hypothetical protein N836_06315 [Leptolyngbya sp. Heron Island J]|uniref:hypothetical protein n=1 Tax=Leptolyngbya sp. Heron Island J TaxID=1385935 RepID=UPI0003B98E28|nr:hypothetical protein [Leptolyngbya sp. Heron Island J]ESA36672.1 hypothetical protein N836_06315 [Leptolyngbya sp. Heron Island J]
MVSVAPSESRKRLAKMGRTLAMQPILFIQALPYVTAQLSAYGISFLKRPVVWMALGVHGALLILPAVDLSAPQQEEIVEPESSEEITIEAVSLSDILAPTEPVPPLAEPQAPPPEAPATVTAAPPVLTEVPEQLEEIIEEPPDEFEDEVEGIFDNEFEDDDSAQAFAFDPAQQSSLSNSLSQFLGASNEGTSNFDVTTEWLGIDPTDPIDIRFRTKDIANVVEPSAFFTPDSINAGTYLPFPQVTFKQIARNIDLVRREGLGKALESAGMSQVEEGLYGGHPFYGVYAADGQPVNYISLIDLKGTTLVFVWPNDPRQS